MFLRSSFTVFFQTLCTCLWNICQCQLRLGFEFREAFQYIGEQQDPKRCVQKRWYCGERKYIAAKFMNVRETGFSPKSVTLREIYDFMQIDLICMSEVLENW